MPVGLDREDRIDLPDPTVAGWYRHGPAPGAVGPAVLVGHVDSRTGPAVFYRLTAVRPGDVIAVRRADGTSATFRITEVTQVRKAAFPTAMVFAPTSTATIRLVTCTGAFDPTSRHYVDSLIVWGTATS